MFYIKRSDGSYCDFEGMAQSQIVAMLAAQGLTCTFISKDEYDARPK